MFDKAVNTYTSTKKFVPECFMTQNMCNKVVNRCFFVFDYIPDQYKTQEMCDAVVSEDPSLIVYCLNKYKTQRMFDSVVSEDPSLIVNCSNKYKPQGVYDKAVDNCLAALKFILYWFVTSKMIKKPFTALHRDENILYFGENFCNVRIVWTRMDILNIDLNNINLDNNFDEDDPDTIIHVRFVMLNL